MKNSIILENLNQTDLKQIVKDSLENEIDRYVKHLSTAPPVELLTRKEVCDLLKIDQSTLWSWTKAGKVNAYAISNRRYYKRNELIDCLTPLK
jgi:hypothetical protein